MHEPLIVSASGIRGVVGAGLTPDVAARFGAAYGTFLSERPSASGTRVLVARDSRTSGDLLLDAVAAGLRSSGWPVVDLGLAPTPTSLLAVQDDREAAGGVIITASHNPVPWNGLKLASEAGEFLSVEDGRRVAELYREGARYAGWDGLGSRGARSGAVEHHVERILDLALVDVEAIRAAGMVVALDTVRGAGGPIMSLLLEELGCRVEGRDLEPDGRFPRPPEPLPENLEGLGRLVRETRADIGLAVDPDVDRLALVAEDGRPVGEDWTLAMAVEYVLARTPGPVVTNLSSSRVIADAAARFGQPIVLAPVGEANVARRMRESRAVVGGEGNGGVMLPSLHLTRDAPLAATLVLGLLASELTTLGARLEERPSYAIAKRKVPRPEGDLEELYGALRSEAGPDVTEDRQDGLRLDWPELGRWVHIRPSGTEPILRVIAEARTPDEADALTTRALARVADFAGDPSAAAG